jgi:hypothetical protein
LRKRQALLALENSAHHQFFFFFFFFSFFFGSPVAQLESQRSYFESLLESHGTESRARESHLLGRISALEASLAAGTQRERELRDEMERRERDWERREREMKGVWEKRMREWGKEKERLEREVGEERMVRPDVSFSRSWFVSCVKRFPHYFFLQISKGLTENAHALARDLAKEKAACEDLREQVRDLMVFLDAREKMSHADEDVREGRVVVSGNGGSAADGGAGADGRRRRRR